MMAEPATSGGSSHRDNQPFTVHRELIGDATPRSRAPIRWRLA